MRSVILYGNTPHSYFDRGRPTEMSMEEDIDPAQVDGAMATCVRPADSIESDDEEVCR